MASLSFHQGFVVLARERSWLVAWARKPHGLNETNPRPGIEPGSSA
jgi:hypothetical protein